MNRHRPICFGAFLGTLTATAFFSTFLSTLPGLAQTPLPPGTSQAREAGSTTLPSTRPPLPDASAIEARKHRLGEFPPMSRPDGGGQIQAVWNTSDAADGVQKYPFCGDCVYKVRTRQFMTTTILLPTDARIKSVDLGDQVGFQVKARETNVLALRPTKMGIDSNLTVLTQAGTAYAFYVRAEGFNSKNTPDLLVRITGRESAEEIAVPTAKENAADEKKASARPQDRSQDLAALRADAMRELTPRTQPGDFLEDVAFDPGKLHGFRDYKLYGDAALRPEVVFRDGRFTYLQYGERWAEVDLPVAYVVADGIDEPINTRVQGRTYIIESTAALITLKSGARYLCIEYQGTGS